MKPAAQLWKSELSAEAIAAAAGSLAEAGVDARAAYWLQSLPSEGGRIALMTARPGGRPRVLTPSPYSVRSCVNEYGGGGYALSPEGIWFVNGYDQGICRLADGVVRRIFQCDGVAFGDLAWDAARRRLLAVAEDHRGTRPTQQLVAISRGGRPVTLVDGADFYAAPRLSPDGSRLAWLEWAEGDMPWDATLLRLGKVTADGLVEQSRTVAGRQGGESLAQPEWSPQGELYVASDRANGFWNLHRLAAGRLVPVRCVQAECARPAFAFAQNFYAFTPEGGLLMAESQGGFWRLLEGGRDGAGLEQRLSELTDVLGVAGGRAGTAVVAGSAAQPTAIFFRPRNTRSFQCLATSFEFQLDGGFVSRPEPFEFATSDDARVHALYFPPAHPGHTGAKPVCLRVRCHGGPTSSSSSVLEPKTLYWTSRGFGALELDYRGSSGYGRGYREALYGAWGLVDVDDARSAARALTSAGLVGASRLVIAGGSAGGLTALLALAGDSPYAAGASHFGVADLVRLMQQTHRFEARYGEKLIGPWPGARGLYENRSPLARAAEIARPVIFFQGLEDPVVPPEQSERMARTLAARGLPATYEAFAGERHGFRRPQTIARVLAAELAFYVRVLGLETEEVLVTPAWLEN